MDSEQQQPGKIQEQPQEQVRQTPFKSSTSPAICKVAAALARAQGKYKPLIKNCEGKVSYAAKDGRPAGGYTFQYADLGAVIEATSEALSSEELSHVALMGGGIIRVMLLHSSGEWLASEAPLVASGGPQQFGAQVTYYRRYLLSPLLGVASEDDDDANGAEGNGFNKTTKTKATQGNTAQQPADKPSEPKGTDAKEHPSPMVALVETLKRKGMTTPPKMLEWMGNQLKRNVAATKEVKPAEVATLTKLANEIPELGTGPQE
jgi:hypothetical protein